MASKTVVPNGHQPTRVESLTRRTALLGSLLGIFALDWAALDDILTGIEPGFVTEWLVLTASVPAILVLLRELRARRDSSP